MKYRDIAANDAKIKDIIESASGGATAAGSIASIANPMGAINRRPSLFGYIPAEQPTKRKRASKKR